VGLRPDCDPLPGLDTMFRLSWKIPVMVLRSKTIRKIQSSSTENLQLPCDVYVVWYWSSHWLKKTSSAVASTCLWEIASG
jgi:hypothetical protein